MQNYIKTVFIRFLEKFLLLNNIYLKMVQIILALVFGLLITYYFMLYLLCLWRIFCFYNSFFYFFGCVSIGK